MAQARAASNGERDMKEDFDSPRSDLDTLRKDFGTLVSTLKDTASSRAEAELDAIAEYGRFPGGSRPSRPMSGLNFPA
jgi:hypothetical protein